MSTEDMNSEFMSGDEFQENSQVAHQELNEENDNENAVVALDSDSDQESEEQDDEDT